MLEKRRPVDNSVDEPPVTDWPVFELPSWLNTYLAVGSFITGIVAIVLSIGLFVAAPDLPRLIVFTIVVLSSVATLPILVPFGRLLYRRQRTRAQRIQWYTTLYDLWKHQVALTRDLGQSAAVRFREQPFSVVGAIEKGDHLYLVLAFPPLLAANRGDILLIINPTSGEQLGRVTVDGVSGDECLVRPMNASDAYNKLFWGRMLEVARAQDQVRTQAVDVLLS